jgi:Nuclease-related domain/Topoisomerase DNA binding C4 zinc finger
MLFLFFQFLLLILLIFVVVPFLFIKALLKGKHRVSKGEAGENLVRKYIEKLAEYEGYEISAFHDLYIPKGDSTTSQIDHVMVTDKGIFVIETKNYEGWIFGSEKAPHWTQTIYKHKQRFQNPLHQNYGHIESLKAFLGEKFTDIPYYSVVIFTNRSELKLKEPFNKSDVINPEGLKRVVDQYPGMVLSLFSQQEIRVKLKVLQKRDKEHILEVQRAHVEGIRKQKEINQTKVNANICPKCGEQLVKRTGKKGEFLGCSSFPKCCFVA